MSSKSSLPIGNYHKKPELPRAIELPTPLYGYTGEKRKELIKEPENRLERKVDQFIPGYTGRKKKEPEWQAWPHKLPTDKTPGYGGTKPLQSVPVTKPHHVAPHIHKS